MYCAVYFEFFKGKNYGLSEVNLELLGAKLCLVS